MSDVVSAHLYALQYFGMICFGLGFIVGWIVNRWHKKEKVFE